MFAGGTVGLGLYMAGTGAAMSTFGAARYGVAAGQALQYLSGLIVTGKLTEAMKYIADLEATPEGRELIDQINTLASDLLEKTTNTGTTLNTPMGVETLQQIQVTTNKLPH